MRLIGTADKDIESFSVTEIELGLMTDFAVSFWTTIVGKIDSDAEGLS